MTPETLRTALDELPAEAPLLFLTDEGEITGGYHVTELKLAHVTAIDCGARRSDWAEATLQLLDGHGGAHMTVGKFNVILAQSIRHVDGLGDAPLRVEFAHGNTDLRLLEIGAPVRRGQKVTIPLGAAHAVCKPAADHAGGCYNRTTRSATCC